MTSEVKVEEVTVVLNTLKYLNYDNETGDGTGIKDGAPIEEVLDNVKVNLDNQQKKYESMSASQITNLSGDAKSDYNQYQIDTVAYNKVQTAVDHSPYLQGMTIGNQENSEAGGMNVCTFSNDDDVFVVFRGTGEREWIDNGEGLTGYPQYVDGTLQQKKATAYFNGLCDKGILKEEQNVYVTGHSKGGNKAQFVTLTADHPEYITACISVDGQGVAPEVIEYMKSA